MTKDIPDTGFYYEPINNPNELVILYQGNDDIFDVGKMSSLGILKAVNPIEISIFKKTKI